MVVVISSLVALIIAIASGGFLAMQLVVGRHWRGAIIGSTCALAGLYLLLGAETVITSAAPADRDWIVLANFIVLALTSGAVIAQVWGSSWLLHNPTARWQRAGLGVMFLCQMSVVVWTAYRFHNALKGSDQPVLQGGINLDEVSGQALLTDKQRLVPVYRARLDGDMRAYYEFDAREPAGLSIQRASEEVGSNCHGWVFAGGQYLLTGSGVKMILEDNGYRPVAAPQPGDVVVYRDELDEIVHTGLVRMAFDDGRVLVESKWGLGGRYLHLAEDQPSLKSFTFYRRSGVTASLDSSSPHLVQAVTVLPGNFVLAPRPKAALADQAHRDDSPQLDGFGNPIPTGEDYPLGAE